MSRLRPLALSGDYRREFLTEGGLHYRKETQNIDPVIQRVKDFSEQMTHANRENNPNGREYLGSIPQTMLIDWLNSRNYTYDQFARNDGGTRCAPGEDSKAHAMLDGGIRSEFLRYFYSRDHSKLHTQHVTTKKKSSQIFTGDSNAELRRIKNGNS